MKTFLFTLFIFFQIVPSFSQTKKTIRLVYDTKNYISDNFINELNRNKKNIFFFQIDSINTALHTVKIDPDFFRKESQLPEVLKPVIPMVSTSVVEIPSFPEMPVRAEVFNLDWYLKKADNIYNNLLTLQAKTQVAYMFLNENWQDTAKCIEKGQKVKDLLAAEFEIANSSGLESKVKKDIIEFNAISDALLTLLAKRLEQPDSLQTDSLLLAKYIPLKIADNYVKTNSGNFVKSIKLLNAMSVCKNHFVSSPYYLKGDFTQLNVKLLKNNYYNASDTLLKEQKMLYSRNYFKFDFSAGFFGNTLINQDYYVDTLANEIRTENNIKQDISIGALLHFKYVATSWFKISPSVGAGLSPFDGKTRYLAGASLIFGRRNEVAFSGGVAIAKLRTLSGAISNPFYGTEANTYEKWESGLFAGISYSFLK